MRFLTFWLILSAAALARADDRPPLVHPIYAQLPNAAEQDVARRELAAAGARYQLGPVEVVDVPPPPAPRAPDAIKAGVAAALKLRFDDALKDLDAAAAEVASSGGAGLDTAQLSDLYLFRAMATARADWNGATAPPAPGDEARARAFDDYLRAATLLPERALNPRELPPQVLADFGRAVVEVRRRARGTLVVRGPADAQLSLDGAPPAPIAGGATLRDLLYGEHVVRVEQVGYAPWGTTLALSASKLDLDVPERAALALDDATAAARARRMGAKFALLAQPRPGPGARLELRLIDVTGVRHDAVVVSVTGEHGALDAAVMRLEEEARRIVALGLSPGEPGPPAPPGVASAPAATPAPVLLAPPVAKAHFSDDPAAWARDHWPLLTAAGVVIGAALILSLIVATDSPPTR